MNQNQNILFIPHHAKQPIQAMMLARKLSIIAQKLGYHSQTADSIKTLSVDTLEKIDKIIIVGQALPETNQHNKPISIIALEQVETNQEESLLQQAIEQNLVPSTPKPQASSAIDKQPLKFVAITACPTGVAHTFMAAEALEQGALKLGYQIDVETQGSVGAKNILSAESIAQADFVILATDIEVNTERFAGKKVYRCGTGFALKQTDKAFANAIAEAKLLSNANVQQDNQSTEKPKEKVGIYKHLLTGVSFMLPMVVAGGLLIALSFVFGIEAFKEPDTLAAALKQVGDAAFLLMVPMLSGYIAYSIADRPGLAPGLIGGVLASQLQAGFLGGIISGFLAGYVALLIAKQLKLPTTLEALKPILIIPLFGSLIVGLLMIYVVGQPTAEIFKVMENFLKNMGTTNAILMGVILGGMMCVDLGGPINKAAYAFTVGLLTTQNYMPMAMTMAGGMVPAIGMGIATYLAKSKFSQNERDAGKASFVLGLCFISEGAIPFAAKDPIRVIPSCILGGAITGALVAVFQNELKAPHGGIFVLLIPNAISHVWLYLLAIAVGSLVTGIVYALVKRSEDTTPALQKSTA